MLVHLYGINDNRYSHIFWLKDLIIYDINWDILLTLINGDNYWDYSLDLENIIYYEHTVESKKYFYFDHFWTKKLTTINIDLNIKIGHKNELLKYYHQLYGIYAGTSARVLVIIRLQKKVYVFILEIRRKAIFSESFFVKGITFPRHCPL